MRAKSVATGSFHVKTTGPAGHHNQVLQGFGKVLRPLEGPRMSPIPGNPVYLFRDVQRAADGGFFPERPRIRARHI